MPAARSKLRTHAPAYFGLALLFLLAFANWANDSFWNIKEIWNGVRIVGDPFALDNLSSATRLRPEATAAGVREGDLVLSVNGRVLRGYSDYYVPLRFARPGDRLDLRIRSKDANGTVEKNVTVALPIIGSTIDAYIAPLIAALQLFCLAAAGDDAGPREFYRREPSNDVRRRLAAAALDGVLPVRRESRAHRARVLHRRVSRSAHVRSPVSVGEVGR